MTVKAASVLLFDELPKQKDLRAAMAKVISGIQHDKGEKPAEIAEKLGVSNQTIKNVLDETTDLNALTIARVGKVYGIERLDPYSRLWGARNTPIQASKHNALPPIANVVHLLAQSGPGAPNHKRLLAMLPTLRDAQAAINQLIFLAEEAA